MKKHIIIALILLLSAPTLFAQQRFTTSGVIEFEKTINLFVLAKDQMGSKPSELDLLQYNNYKKTAQQFRVLPATLVFDNDKTFYTPKPIEIVDKVMGNDNPMAKQFNTVYQDFTAGITTVQKTVYEDVYLLKDSTRKVNWKLTDETREIAGHMCRRANALVMDSIYAVAYYTNDIHVSGGPETFAGLPGMILGLALPHEGVKWFATKVTDTTVQPIAPPKKGKPVDTKKLKGILWETLKGWTYANRGLDEMKFFML